MEILAIIPARGGSKGLPGKNIKILGDKPLIAHTIIAAKESKFISRSIVSTDSSKIANIAKNFGAEIPFIRPDYLATDEATSVDVVLHLLQELKKDNYVPDFVCLLQCTSPFRNSTDIDSSVEKCLNTNFDACYSVSKVSSSPYWMKVFDGEKLSSFMDNKTILRRQDLPMIYELNGAIYFVKTSELIKNKSLHLSNATGYIMPEDRSIDIDSALDFELAKLKLRR
ncbi:acylneuraminate cytidylyltransferase [Candidatus Epulonipiscioides gigas]|nr:acylneuraminate cytidylyltransferase [Epulopiscium sp. SCG-C07WGA-EpuloA2]